MTLKYSILSPVLNSCKSGGSKMLGQKLNTQQERISVYSWLLYYKNAFTYFERNLLEYNSGWPW